MSFFKRVRAGDAAVGITLLVALALALNVSEWLRGGYGWRWNYELVPLLNLLPMVLVALVYGAGVWWLLRRTSRAAPLLLWAILGAVALTLAGIYARSGDPLYDLFARTASFLATGQQWLGTHVDWAGGEWRSWADVMTRIGGHLSNVPPGAPMLYGLASDVLDHIPAVSVPVQRWLMAYACNNYDLLAYTPGQWASSLLGMLMPLWSALTVVPLYFTAKRFVGADARWCAVWWALVPAAIGFAGSWSTLYPLIAVAVFGLLAAGLARRQRWLLLLSGLVCGVGLFVNFALVPLLLLIGLYALGYVVLIERRGVLAAVVCGVWFGVGMALPWLLYGLASGETPFSLLSASMAFHLSLDRPYWFWVGMHLWDWLLWTGVGFAVLGIVFLWRWRRARTWTPFALLTGALALTMLMMIISGTARGETGRVWLFFSPFLLIVGAGALRHLQAPHFGWMTAAQAFYAVALVASLNAMSTDLTPPPSVPVVNTSQPADATFNAGETPLFRLAGWEATAEGDSIDLRLNWQGLSASATPYWFGVVLVSPNGESIGSEPWQPGLDAGAPYPTTCWAGKAQVGDEIRLALPANAAPGDWWISLSAYGETADTRLTVTQAGQPPDVQVGLGPIHISNEQ